MNENHSIKEMNYIIGVFDGKYFTGSHITDYTSETAPIMKYHLRWDWLMPVVKKFMEIPSETFNYNVTAMTGLWQCKAALKGMSIMTPIEDVYNTLACNIKWYNQQNKLTNK